MSPAGLTTTEPPGNPLPPSNPTRLANATHTPCSSAMPRRMRSHRTTLAGSRMPSSSIPVPRAGDALGTITSWAPWSSAIVPESECHASSQIRIAARRRLELGDLRQHAADLLQIGAVITLSGAELRDREAGHGGKIGGNTHSG